MANVRCGSEAVATFRKRRESAGRCHRWASHRDQGIDRCEQVLWRRNVENRLNEARDGRPYRTPTDRKRGDDVGRIDKLVEYEAVKARWRSDEASVYSGVVDSG